MIGDFEITVKRAALLDTLKANKARHEEDFKATFAAYSKALGERLEAMLAEVREGKPVSLHALSVKLPKPESHADDYDRVIGMLDMSVAEDVTITEQQYSQFVRDQWGWRQSYDSVSSSYKGG